MAQVSVFFNDLTAIRQRSGVGGYTEELLTELSRLPVHGLLPLSKTYGGALLHAATRSFEKLRPKTLTDGGRETQGPVKVRITQSTQRLIAHYAAASAKIHRPLLYHEPDAIALPLDIPTLTTFHDLSVLRFPNWHPKHRVLKYEKELERSVNQTSLFISVSRATAKDMTHYLGVDPARIRIIPEAPRRPFRQVCARESLRVRKRYGLGEDYFLFLGTIEPRKNVDGLLDGYARLPVSLQKKYQLVLAGGWGWNSENISLKLQRSPWRGRVCALGFVPDNDLVGLLCAAKALVYPSHHEGFGLPPLEAMACGIPVITTSEGALEETVGSAAWMIDHQNTEKLTEALSSFALNPELCKEYRERGLKHVSQYSWRRTAELTAVAYQEVLEGRLSSSQ